MKKTNIILTTFILLLALVITHSYAIDLNLINSIRANEMDSASNITTNTISNTSNSSTGIDLTLDPEENDDDDDYNYTDDNDTSDDEYYTNNTENTSTNNVSNNVSSILEDTPEADLGLANILNILLIVVGVLLILLGIAILIRTKR